MIATNAEVVVRLASEADASTLARLRYEFRSSFQHLIEHEVSFVGRCTAWMQENLQPESHWKCWIAECQKTAVGNVWAKLVEKIPNPLSESEQFVYLTNFYVREEYRRKGIGSMLLSEALAWSRSRNAQTVILWPTEESRSFYLRYGFAPPQELMELAIEQRRTNDTNDN